MCANIRTGPGVDSTAFYWDHSGIIINSLRWKLYFTNQDGGGVYGKGKSSPIDKERFNPFKEAPLLCRICAFFATIFTAWYVIVMSLNVCADLFISSNLCKRGTIEINTSYRVFRQNCVFSPRISLSLSLCLSIYTCCIYPSLHYIPFTQTIKK